MKAAVLHRHGGPPTYEDHPDPVLNKDQSLVRVTAAPIVPLDLLCAGGTSYFGPPAIPYVPGVQGVGSIVDSPTLAAGIRVWFATSAGMSPGDGSMAELCAVGADDLVPIDVPIGDAEVAAVGTSGVAAWMALTWRADLQPGNRVIVLGASGVVGRVALAVARTLGAGRVVAVCRSADIEPELLAHGADAVVILGDGAVDVDDLAARLQQAAHGPADVVIDPVFGDPATAAAAALGPGGRLVNLGGTADDTARFSSSVLRGRTIAILGYTNNALTAEQRATALHKALGVAAADPGLVRPILRPAMDCRAAWAQAGAGRGRRVVLQF